MLPPRRLTLPWPRTTTPEGKAAEKVKWMKQDGGRRGGRKSEDVTYTSRRGYILMLQIQENTVVTPADDGLLSTSKDAVGAKRLCCAWRSSARGLSGCALADLLWPEQKCCVMRVLADRSSGAAPVPPL